MYYSRLNYRKKKARMMIEIIKTVLSGLLIVVMIGIVFTIVSAILVVVFGLLAEALIWVWMSLTGDVMPHEIAITIVATYVVSIIWLGSSSSLSSRR